MREDLVEALDDPLITVVQHGFRHRNFAAPGQRAVECGGDRPLASILRDLDRGRDRLEAVFGERFEKLLVPPWNRIDPCVQAALGGLGFRALSTFGPCEPERKPIEINAHLDVLTWKGGARFAGRQKVIRLAAERIASRREGGPAPVEPFGLLTHHLSHDEATWDFLSELLALLVAHPAVRLRHVGSLITGELPMTTLWR